VIWWRGHGAYVGSANITQKAWYNNIESGLFLTEAELTSSGQADDIERLFRAVDEHSASLTQELYNAIEARSRQLQA
jgi:phosphatidylserine/phosphatidylglycerophosphate/cardiolipin synthase-like enzyme